MLKEPSEQTIYIEHDTSVEVTFENIPKSALVIRKIDSDTGAPLANAWFRVRYLGGTSGSGGTISGEYQTSSNGITVITGLDAGTYVVEEISAPRGCVMDTAPQTAYISGKEQDCITLTFTNSKYGALLVKKVDSITGEPLSDIQFFITTSDGAVVGNGSGCFTTDSAGTILVSDIMPGTTLVVKETRTRPGCILDDMPQTVKIESNETKTLEFRNQPTGSLLIRKVCSINPSVTLANAEFKVACSDGSLIGDSNGVYRSDENGEVRIEGLTPGKSAVITETKAPAGYVMDSPSTNVVIGANGDTQTVIVKNSKAGTLVIDKRDSVTNKPLSGIVFKVIDGSGAAVGPDDGIYFTDKDGEVQSLTFWNKRDCSLTILKQSTDKTPLPGAVFHVTDEDGAAIGTNNGRHTGDRNGLITITGLQPGQIVIVTEEKAPNGYSKDPTPKTIKIKQGVANSLIFENAKTGCLIINERSSADKKVPLEGVTFKITTTNGSFLPDADGKISSNGLYYTDENGQIILNSVVGSLVVTEMQSIDGYTIHEANRTQTVEAAPDDTQTLYFYNDPLCSLTLRKVDSVTGKPVPNTEFTVRYSDGSLIGKFVTGKDGTVTNVIKLAHKDARQRARRVKKEQKELREGKNRQQNWTEGTPPEKGV